MYKRTTLILLLFLVLSGVVKANQVDILESSDKGITLEYTPQSFVSAQKETGVIRVRLADGDLLQTPGRPEIPLKVIVVAIPPGASPSISLLSRESGQVFSGKLPICEKDENAVITSDRQLMSSPDQVLGDPVLTTLSGVRVARIPIFPASIRTNPAQVEIARRVKFRVDFNNNDFTRSTNPVRLNRIAQMVIVNRNQALGWNRLRTSDFDTPFWPQGYLYHFEINQDGMYKLTFEEMIAAGIDLPRAGFPSSQLRLFCNGGTELPLQPGADAPLGLKECAIFVSDDGDSVFGSGDYIIFYGRSTSGWIQDDDGGWNFEQNIYTTRNKYWINLDPSGGGLRMNRIDAGGQSPEITTEYAPYRIHQESERFIYGSSLFSGTGRRWYGYTLDGPPSLQFVFDLIEPDLSDPVEVKFRLVNASSRYSSWIEVRLNEADVLGYSPSTHTSQGERILEGIGQHIHSGVNTISFEQTREMGTAIFDWLEVRYMRKLEGSLTFEEIDFNGVVQYSFTPGAPLWIFDVTDYDMVEYANGSSMTIDQAGRSSRRYHSVTDAGFLKIKNATEYFPPEADIADLWSAGNQVDILLITPDNYWETVEPLKDHYASKSIPLRAARIRLSEIYNRFSGGLLDPAAIRNLLHYAQDFWNKPPDYVVLCGDGDYNYRDIDRPRSENFLPPYENGGTSSDDWFVDFAPDNGDLLPEMVIGRLTATSAWELSNIIEKSIEYSENPYFGTWRNRITMVADDEFGEGSNDEDEHVRGTEDICINYLPDHLEKVRIYLTEYDRKWGRDKPQAAQDLISTINRGTLLVNYMGHGNPTLWAHEHVFVQSRDYAQIEDSRKLPLYVAFTCDWAYWDNPSAQSFPEQLLARQNGGAIGIIASTRLTYAHTNTELARSYFRTQFGPERLTIGETLAFAKQQALISLGPTYHLLGDPALYLGSPRLSGEFLSLNPYPLKPLDVSSLTGRIFNTEGEFNPGYNGEIELALLDTDIPRKYTIIWYDSQGNEHEIILNYSTIGTGVYHGGFTVSDGQFNGSFVVPRDATLGADLGRLHAYFHNDDMDGIIAADSIRYDESVADATDDTPPEIEVFFEHRGYRSGDRISSNPLLIVDVADSSGLNLTGIMGHGIYMIIDGIRQIDLTSAFQYNIDSFQSGSLEQNIGPLEPGMHSIEIQAWDSFNNLSVKTLEVEITDSDGGLMVDRVLNWPNPFREVTNLTFMVNRPVEYEVQVYTVGGRLLRRFEGSTSRAGLVSGVVWDGNDHAGRTVANGVYLYKVIARDDDGHLSEGLGRIAYIR